MLHRTVRFLSAWIAALVVLLGASTGAAANEPFLLSDQESEVYYTLGMAAGEKIKVDKDTVIEGSLHSNLDVDLKKGTSVEGDVTAVGRLAVDGTVSGTATSGAELVTLPGLLDAESLRALADRTFEGDTTFTDATVDDVVFVDGNAHFEGSLNGVGTIIATGDVRVGKADRVELSELVLSLPQDFAAETTHSVRVTVRDGKGNKLVDEEEVSFAGTELPTEAVDVGAGSNDGNLALVSISPMEVQLAVGVAETEKLRKELTIEAVVDGVTYGPVTVETEGDAIPLVGDALGPFVVDSTAARVKPGFASLVLAADATFAAGTDYALTATLLDGAGKTTLDVETVSFAGGTLPVSGVDASVGSASGNLAIELVSPLEVQVRVSAGTGEEKLGGDYRVELAIGETVLDSGRVKASGKDALNVGERYGDFAVHDLVRVGEQREFLSQDTQLSLIALGDIHVHKDRDLRGVLVAANDVRLEKNSVFAGVLVAGHHVDVKKESTVRFVDFDVVAPVIELLAPAEGSFLPTAAPTVSASYGDDFSGVKTETVRVVVDGEDRTGEATVTASGVELVPDPALVEGPHVVELTLEDHSANAVTALLSFTTDTIPPALGIGSPLGGDYLSLTAVDVTGEVVDATPTTVVVDGVSATVDASAFTAAAVPLPAEGPVTLEAVATDAAGNAASTAVTVTRDTIPPTLAIASPDAGAYLSLEAVDVSGDVVDATPTSVIVNGVGASVADTSYTAAAVALPAEGPVTVEATATDAAGNATSTSVTVTRDTIPPTLAIASPDAGAYLSLEAVDVTGDVVDATPTSVVVNGVGASVADATYTAPAVALPAEGPVTVEATATDAAGNSAAAAITVTRDTIAPTISIAGVADGQESAAPLVPTFTATDVNLDTSSALLDGEPFTSGTTVADDLVHVLSVEAVDLAGNAAASSVSFTIDQTPPELAITSPAEGEFIATATAVATGTATDNLIGVASVTVDGVEAALAGGTWSAEVPVSGATATLEVVATDALGNAATASVTVVLDITPPTLTITGPANGLETTATAVTVSGTFADAAPVVVDVNGIEATNAGETFSVSVPLGEGLNELVVTATDAAGNATDALVVVTSDTTPPALAVSSPQAEEVLDSRTVTVSGTASDAATAIVTLTVNGVDAELADGAFTAAIELAKEGGNRIDATAIDRVGNVAQVAVEVTRDTLPPEVVITSPVDGKLTRGETVTVHGVVFDATPQSVTVNGTPAELTSGSFKLTGLALDEGSNTVSAVATDLAGNTGAATIAVTRDSVPPALAIDSPGEGASFTSSPVTVSGTSDASSVTVNGILGSVEGGSFSVSGVKLADGANVLAARASDAAGNTAEAAVTVSFAKPQDTTPPVVTILSPAKGTVTQAGTIVIEGTLTDETETFVEVNGKPATVTGGTWSATVSLREGVNNLCVRATDAANNAGSASVTVTRDSVAPTVAITSPAPGAVTNAATILVTGNVFDMVSNALTATVNGQPAQVSGGSFVLEALPLVNGPNTITVEVTDEAGNTGTGAVDVTFQSLVGARVETVAGNNQSAVVSELLPEPLSVRLVDAAGAPVAGRKVTFAVVRSDGVLDGGARTLKLTTDADGLATTGFTMGTRVGTASDQVKATASGFAGEARFCASALPEPAERIKAHSGSNGSGLAGQPLAAPFIALVTDAMTNPVAGVDVIFTATAGGGTFENGLDQIVVASDAGGFATATLFPGEGANTVEASFAGNAGLPATFVATGKVEGPAAETRVTGIVLTSQGVPIEGVTMRLLDTPAPEAITDAEGQFSIQPAPIGNLTLEADGSTATAPVGPFPELIFPLTTVSGTENELPRPIYLPIEDVEQFQYVDELATEPTVLPMRNVPGFEVIVEPGAATFADGGKSGYIGVTQVNKENVPSEPLKGSNPSVMSGLFPPGVHFDPPAKLSTPNLGALAPGTIVEQFSFDHDMGDFVPIGVGQVTEDGTRIVSLPGSGLRASGWHGSFNPPPPTTTVISGPQTSIGSLDCSATALNRTASTFSDGSFAIFNVPADQGSFRVRVVCDVDDTTVSGESELLSPVPNGTTSVGPISLGITTEIPVSLIMLPPDPTVVVPADDSLEPVLLFDVFANEPDGTQRQLTAEELREDVFSTSDPDVIVIDQGGGLVVLREGEVMVNVTFEGAVSGVLATAVAVDSDRDGDGLPNDLELEFGLDPDDPTDALADLDGDGLTSQREVILQTDPFVFDTDLDGLGDGDEADGVFGFVLDPLNSDTDADGLTDGDEVLVHLTNPITPDTDGDGIFDGIEVGLGLSPLTSDSDGDGVLDGDEDSDGDGLSNLVELNVLFTDPGLIDTDGDGISDFAEDQLGTDPRNLPPTTTTVVGRVVDESGAGVPGATVRVTETTGPFDLAVGASAGDGTFGIPAVAANVGDIQIAVEAELAGSTLRGTSPALAPVPGGSTDFGDTVVSSAVRIDCFTPELLATFESSDDTQFVGRSLTGTNIDTAPGEWRIVNGCDLDPPQGSNLDGRYCPMFEQIIDPTVTNDVRIEVSLWTGSGSTTHPGILFRGVDANTYGWLYLRPHSNGSTTAVVLSSATDGFIGGPHFEGLAGFVNDVGFNRQVDLVLEIVHDRLSLDVNGVRRIDGFDIAGVGYSPSGVAGVAICDNRDPSTRFLSFAVTPLD